MLSWSFDNSYIEQMSGRKQGEKREGKRRQLILTAILVLVLILHSLVMCEKVTWYNFEVVLDFVLSSFFVEQYIVFFFKDREPDSETNSRKTLPHVECGGTTMSKNQQSTYRIKFVPFTDHVSR